MICPMCSKEAFATKHIASLIAKAARKRKNSRRLRPYFCEQGGGYWHLTSTPNRRKK